jgi:hypothetical protein
MSIILFPDSEYEGFDYRLLKNDDIVITKCMDSKFLNTLYIRGLKVIFLYKDSINVDIVITKDPQGARNGPSIPCGALSGLVCPIGALSGLDCPKGALSGLDCPKGAPEDQVEDMDDRAIIYDYTIHNMAFPRFEESSEVYESFVPLLHTESILIDPGSQTGVPNKFQKTMYKEAKKLLYAENREKYKKQMRQSSLSNKKSSDKKKA